MQASSSTTSSPTLGDQLLVLVRRLTLDPGADHLRVIEDRDLSISQVRALMVIASADEPQAGGRVAERLGISPAAISRALDGLVRDGLLERRESEQDRRLRLFAITDAGRSVTDELNALRRAQLDRFVSGLDERQREALGEALAAIVGEEAE